MAYVPVKATLSTMGWLAIAAPAVGPYPGTMLTTPAGKPASLMSSAMYSPVKGVCSANFITTVFPVASAGPNFQACKIITLKITHYAINRQNWDLSLYAQSKVKLDLQFTT